jgi:hypothetical protein
MDRDDVIRLAREAGLVMYDYSDPSLERFASLVAAAERDACAKLVDYWEARQGEHSEAIRARGKHD